MRIERRRRAAKNSDSTCQVPPARLVFNPASILLNPQDGTVWLDIGPATTAFYLLSRRQRYPRPALPAPTSVAVGSLFV